MKTISPIYQSRATSTVAAIATTAAVAQNSTPVEQETAKSIKLMVENDAKSYLVEGSSRRYTFPTLNPVDKRPLMTVDEFKNVETDSLAVQIYTVPTGSLSIKYNPELSPLKRLKVLQAIFQYVAKNKDEKNLSFTKLNPSNVKITIDEDLSSLEKLGRRVANSGGKIDVNVECPTFEKASEAVSDTDERSAMTAFCMQVMGVSIDCNGFAIMPRWVDGSGSTWDAPTILMDDPASLELTSEILEAAGSHSCDQKVEDSVKELRKLPITADAHDRVATFVHMYNFKLLERFIWTARVESDSNFEQYILEFSKKLGGRISWNHVSTFITKYSESQPELFEGVELELDAAQWHQMVDDVVQAIRDTRRHNRLRIGAGAIMSPVIITGTALMGLASIFAKH